MLHWLLHQARCQAGNGHAIQVKFLRQGARAGPVGDAAPHGGNLLPRELDADLLDEPGQQLKTSGIFGTMPR